MLDRRPDGTLVALLSGFGTAEDFNEALHDDDESTYWEGPTHKAPKQVNPPYRVFDEATDLWSFGCTALQVSFIRFKKKSNSLLLVLSQVLEKSLQIWPLILRDATPDMIMYSIMLQDSHRYIYMMEESLPRPAPISETDPLWTFIENRCFCKNPRDRVTASQARLELGKLM